MPKLLRLKIKDILKVFFQFSFEIISQKGSHIKISRKSKLKEDQILIIPNHKELDIGTIKAIYNQALKYITEEELYKKFYK